MNLDFVSFAAERLQPFMYTKTVWDLRHYSWSTRSEAIVLFSHRLSIEWHSIRLKELSHVTSAFAFSFDL